MCKVQSLNNDLNDRVVSRKMEANRRLMLIPVDTVLCVALCAHAPHK